MLTNEKLQAYASGEIPCGSVDVEEIFTMARELLAIREAGDGEADGYHGVVQYFLTNTYLEGEDIDDRITAQIGNDKLRDIAITRGQRIRGLEEELRIRDLPLKDKVALMTKEAANGNAND